MCVLAPRAQQRRRACRGHHKCDARSHSQGSCTLAFPADARLRQLMVAALMMAHVSSSWYAGRCCSFYGATHLHTPMNGAELAVLLCEFACWQLCSAMVRRFSSSWYAGRCCCSVYGTPHLEEVQDVSWFILWYAGRLCFSISVDLRT